MSSYWPGPVLIAGATVAVTALLVTWLDKDNDWGPLAANRELAEIKSKDEAVEAQLRDVLHRIQIKRALVQEVIDGRIRLRQAAAQFAELNSVFPVHMNMLRRMYPAMSDQDIMCRNVMSFVATELQGRPEESAGVLARLEQEMAGK